jgi:hypothetical protein
MDPASFNPHVEHPGGCYACRWFGHRVDVAVWCARPSGEHVRSQAERGCAFWEREPGADDGSASGLLAIQRSELA